MEMGKIGSGVAGLNNCQTLTDNDVAKAPVQPNRALSIWKELTVPHAVACDPAKIPPGV